ncbi:phage tail sheath C-terminal domain-containing protein [Sphingobium sp.]|uniref:phage tail sheath C-terminal domain-containing protein n=1 Tax=Sphingobium sp. TaxID=1912891 RepID=UPI000DB0FD47|nr:phage tail sheath C-terminal domain-containing protein [Sphingobium sp.]PZU62591.1 MAG: hypothetical protein DI540_26360 [Sphingobium sp.]
MAFKHGITLIEVADGPRTLTAASTAIIGMVAIAADADPAIFPLDRPALITDVETAIGAAGTDGTLALSLRAIADHARPIIVVVRVAEGDDAAETASNVIGTTDANGQKTGMQALLAAQAQLGVKPKILVTPGLETQAVTTALGVVAQLLADTIVNGMMWAIDKPLPPALAKDIIETINGFFRQLKGAGIILGANAWFDETPNSIENLKAGKLRIDYDYTVPPPLEDLGRVDKMLQP